jgi:endo-1,4-beta-xylanase
MRRLFLFALPASLALACGTSSTNPEQGAAGASAAAPMAGRTASGGSPSAASSGGNAATSTPQGGTSPSSSGGAPTGGSAAGGAAGANLGGGGATGGGAVSASGGIGPAGSSSLAGGAGGAPPSSAGESAMGGTSQGGAPATGGAPPSAGGSTSLRDRYINYFPIGAAVDSQSYTTHAALLTKHFSSITAENEMKFDSLQPSEGRFTYDAADRIVDFATRSNMKVRGHALVWHRQTPDWMFSNGSGGTASREVLLSRMKTHISNVVQHFRGKVYVWDVVNEAMMDDGMYRTGNEVEGQVSRWYEIAGESYIAEAFRYAHEADPDAKLFYNDYYNYIPAKQQAIHAMLQQLLADGVPVHGVGLQAHLNVEPSTIMTNQAYHQHVANMEDAIELYASLGLEVQITELDVSLYIPGVMYTESTFYTPATFTTALQQQQAARYRAFFELFRKHVGVITSVTFWGVADDNTWLSEFTSGRQDFPLLFDHSHQPKPAYEAVMDF